jgi:DNA polymerase-3 subunit alpha
MAQFVHLHVHTQYSILDGAASIPSIIARAKEYGMEAVAMTDHGNMYGAKEFYDATSKAGIKPIIGCEAYIVADRHQKNKDTERIPTRGDQRRIFCHGEIQKSMGGAT